MMAVTVITSMAVAQSPPLRVEQGIADVDSNALIRVDTWVDYRQEIGWESVFRLESTDRFGQQSVMFARRSGAVSAVFPRSVYSWTEQGPLIDVPPGTVFHFGAMEDLMKEPAPAPRSPMWINRRIDLQSSSSISPDRPRYRRDDRAGDIGVRARDMSTAEKAIQAEMAGTSNRVNWLDDNARQLAVAIRLAQAREAERQWEAQLENETADAAEREPAGAERP